MWRPTYAQTQRLRGENGATAALFLTDRCPVGCAHCSVDSRVDRPAVTDYPLLEEILAGLVAAPVELVAVTGGEPFAERRALPLAVRRLHEGGTGVVLFTSGYWARGPHCPGWIVDVLGRVGTVFLSTDRFHRDAAGGGVDGDRFGRAAGFVAEAGCRLVVQTLDQPGEWEFAATVLSNVYGPNWSVHADLVLVPPLARGRGRQVFALTRRHPLAAFGPCATANAPTVRFDGRVTGCCNEDVAVGAGPAALRRQVRTRRELTAALASLREAPLLRAVRTLPLAEIARLPGLGGLTDHRYPSICAACWRAHDLTAADPRAAAAVAAAAAPG
jgi:hypothetical protein